MNAGLELLRRHRPLLRYDRQYDYRAASALTIVTNPGNLLRTADGEVIARAGSGESPALSLELLTSYPEELEPREDDCLSEAPDFLGDARRMERDERLGGRLYGRAVDDGGLTWLQYWFWLYYNPKNLFGFGKHEGDWEMVQVGLDGGGEPRLATYAQHDTGEARAWDELELVRDAEGVHPVVYVAPLSHASYFESGTHPYPVGIDHPYGDGPQALLPLDSFGPWAEWPGRWGNTERVILRTIGNGPRSPTHQEPKWSSPAAFHRRCRRRRLRALIGRLLHGLGRATFPLAPEIEAGLEGETAVIDYRLRQARFRRARHLFLTVHDGDRVVASRVVRDAPASGHELVRLPYGPDRFAVWATSFNRLRQRSDLARDEPAGIR
jgi:hypothetical protein